MTNNQQTYVMNLSNMTDAQWDEFQKVMDTLHDEQTQYINTLADEMKVSVDCAGDIVYLRSRSRWTQELENQLIQLYKEGKAPNIFEFGF